MDAASNLRGMVMMCKHVIPSMKERQSGAIVNISSNAVSSTYPYVAYKASKSGVVAFTEQLACALFWSLLLLGRASQ